MKNAVRNWGTSITGILMLALAGVGIWTDPVKATDPNTLGLIVGGLGLIKAKDSNVTGTTQEVK